MNMQNETNPYMPVSGEMKDNIPATEPQQEQHIYTETWMNQNSTSSNPINSVSRIFREPDQNMAQFGTNPYMSLKPKGIGFSIAGMVCGILSMMACILLIFDLLLAIPGLVFSIISLTKKYDGKGMAVAGVVCSACGTVLSIGFMIFCLSF